MPGHYHLHSPDGVWTSLARRTEDDVKALKAEFIKDPMIPRGPEYRIESCEKPNCEWWEDRACQ